MANISLTTYKTCGRASMMTTWVKVPAAKPGDLNYVSETHIKVEKKANSMTP